MAGQAKFLVDWKYIYKKKKHNDKKQMHCTRRESLARRTPIPHSGHCVLPAPSSAVSPGLLNM